jgi:protein involved in ribonucleotide reduction
MIIAYDSKTGNVKRFVNKLNMNVVQISEDTVINEPFVLITYTTGFGQVPKKVAQFLDKNHENLVGVAASGNKNWGDMFCKSADTISDKYKVPVVAKFELSGTKKDVENFRERVMTIETHRVK